MKPLRMLLILLGSIVIAELVSTAVRFIVWRSHWQPALDVVRWLNKKTPAMLKKPGTSVTVVHHRGRTSGREYATPVLAERVGPSFYIQLPYGTDVDWCHNVLAAGGCTLERGDGVRYETVNPVILPAAAVVRQLPRGMRAMQRLADIESYLRLDIVP